MRRCVSAQRLKDEFWQALVRAAREQLTGCQQEIERYLTVLYKTNVMTPHIPSEVIALYLDQSEQYYNHGDHN